MKQILILSITALTEKIYIAFMLFVFNALDKFEVLNQKCEYYVNQFKAAYNHLNYVYLKYDTRKLTEAVQEADKTRVEAYRKLRAKIRYEATYSDNEAVRTAAGTLLEIIELYGDATKMKAAEKTTVFTNLVEDYEEKYPTEVAAVGVGSLVTELKEAQQAYDTAYYNRAEAESQKALKEMADARKKMDEAYRDLVTIVNLEAKRDEEGEFTGFINLMNVEIRKNFVNSGQTGTHTSTGSDSETSIPMKNATFEFVGGNSQKFRLEVGAPLEALPNTDGYIWKPEVPKFMPNRNIVFREVPVDDKKATATFHYFDHREEEIRQLVGSVLNAPANTTGYKWDPTVPATMPAQDTSYYELPVENNDNNGGDNNGGNNGNYPPGYDPDADDDPGV